VIQNEWGGFLIVIYQTIKRLFDLEILGCGFAAIGDQLKLHLLTFVERAQAGTLDRRDMDEDVPTTAATGGLDETVTLLRIEPLNRSRRHSIDGGVPIKVGNDTIAGVGVPGSPGKDEECVNAGIAKVQQLLQ
jgi:hypothetical protein